MPLVALAEALGLLLTGLIVLPVLLKPRHALFSSGLGLVGALIVSIALLSWHSGLLLQLPAHPDLSLAPVAVRIDRLASIFLMLLGAITFCCALYSPTYLSDLESKINSRFYWSSLFLFVAGMAFVIVTANAIAFLVAWEVMSLSSTLLVVSEYRQHKAQRAALIYLVATRIATAFLCGGFLYMFASTNSWNLDAWTFDSASRWPGAALILTGLCIKAGIWPCHIWLPYAHPEAPTPVSALMSGVMVKVAAYAAIRFFVIGHLTCQPIAYTLFGLSCISAFWGVLFAINQHEIKKLLAYHTVENISLITLGISLAIWARNLGLFQVAQLALAGSVFHCLAHGLFKSQLFMCAGSVDHSAHSREFSRLGGLAKSMPWTCATFVLGCASICAVPPLNGFGSKWLFYQALLNSTFQMHSVIDRAICLSAIGVLACVGALAVGCFAKAIGVAFLGKPRSKQAALAVEASPFMIAAQVVLGLACVVMGLNIPRMLTFCSPLLAEATSATASLIVPGDVHFGSIAIFLCVTAVAIYALALRKRPAKYITWDCGFGAHSAKQQVTADSFAQPIATIFAPLLQYSVEVEIAGSDRRHFPQKISVQPSMSSLLETRVYAPALGAINFLSSGLGKLQAGSIHIYLLYLCVALLVLIGLGIKAW